MDVIPIAGYDSMLLNLSGAHEPVFIRNLVILHDNNGNKGVGEVPGSERIRQTLKAVETHVVGSKLGDINHVLNTIRRDYARLDASGRGQQTFDQRIMIHVVTAIESAFLDLIGQVLGVPVCALLGAGQQRDNVPVLGYLFFIGDIAKSGIDYKLPSNPHDEWESIRLNKTINAEGIVHQACAAHDKFGFDTFKLKGGVLAPHEECDCMIALHEALPDVQLTIDPNGCWSLDDAVKHLKPLKEILLYAEDPCSSERGLSGLEVLARFRQETGIATATNMVAVDFAQLQQAIELKALDVPLADCHFWTMQGAVRVSMLCELWGLTWGSHSNNHFDVSLAMMTHVAAAASGRITPIDSHWIWQTGQGITKEPLTISNGAIKVPDKPGLGIEVDDDKLHSAQELYQKAGISQRNDARIMQTLIPDWKFDARQPCMMR